MENKKIKRINRILSSIEKDLPSDEEKIEGLNFADDQESEDIDDSLVKIKKIKDNLINSNDMYETNRKIKILSRMMLRYL